MDPPNSSPTKADSNTEALNLEPNELSSQSLHMASLNTNSDEQAAQVALNKIDNEKHNSGMGNIEAEARDNVGDWNETTDGIKGIPLEESSESNGENVSANFNPDSSFLHDSLSTTFESGQTSSTSLKVGDVVEIRVSIDAEWCAGNVCAIYEDGSYRVQSTNGEYVTQKIGDCLRLCQRASSQGDVAPIENDLPEREVNLLKAEGSSIEKSLDLSFVKAELVQGSKVKVKHPQTGLDAQATIECAHADGTFDIIFDNEERLTHVLADSIKSLSHHGASTTNFCIGDLVECNFGGEGKWSAATISEVHSDGSYDLISNDGYREDNVQLVNIRHSLAKQESLNSDESFCQGDKVEARYCGGKKFYSGTISKRNPDGTYVITYDDGDIESMVSRNLIRRHALNIRTKDVDTEVLCEGTTIEGNFLGKGRWFLAKVSRVRADGTYDIEYNDGDIEKGVIRERIKVIGLPSQVSVTSNNDEASKLHEGTKVEAQYKGCSRFYPGKISRARLNGTYDIDYDDGERETGVARELIRVPGSSSIVSVTSNSDEASKLHEGTKVEAQYRGRSRFYPGKISRARLNGTYDIDYDDGERETGVARELIRVPGSSSIVSVTSNNDEASKLHEGTKVEAQYRGRSRFYPGKISRARLNGTYDIDYDDGERETGVARELIRVPGSSSIVSVTSNNDEASKLHEGTKVEAQYKGRSRFYPGKISRARLNGTYDIDYDDGERETGVARELIRVPGSSSIVSVTSNNDEASKLHEGTKVEAQYKGRSRFYPGKISRARLNGTYDIDYDDGERETGVARELIRVPGSSSIVSVTSNNDEASKLHEGTKVEAQYRGRSRFYPGKISRARLNGTYDIDYDDGERETGVARELIRVPGSSSIVSVTSNNDEASKLHEGTKVEAQYKGRSRFYPGKISRARLNGTYDIDYDDGERETGVARELIRVPGSSSIVSVTSNNDEASKLHEGTKVEAQYKGRSRFYPGKISRARLNGTYDIDYDDGERETGVARELIRVPGSSSNSPESSNKFGKNKICKGTRVEARYMHGSKYYAGKISRVHLDGTYDILYDDGEEERRVARDLIRTIGRPRTISTDSEGNSGTFSDSDSDSNEDEEGSFQQGDRIEARFNGGGKYYPAVISRVHLDGTYDINYDDGDKQRGVERSMIRIDKKSTLNKVYDQQNFQVLAEGVQVEAPCKDESKLKKGIIDRRNADDTYNIRFDDGEFEVRVDQQSIKVIAPQTEQSINFAQRNDVQRSNLKSDQSGILSLPSENLSIERSDSERDLYSKYTTKERSHQAKTRQRERLNNVKMRNSLEPSLRSRTSDESRERYSRADTSRTRNRIADKSRTRNRVEDDGYMSKTEADAQSAREQENRDAIMEKLKTLHVEDAENLLYAYLSMDEKSCEQIFNRKLDSTEQEQENTEKLNGKHSAFAARDYPDHMTMLMYAAKKGHHNVVKFLVRHATNPDARYNLKVNLKEATRGYSALMLAVEGGHVKIVNELVRYRLPLETLKINDRASPYAFIPQIKPREKAENRSVAQTITLQNQNETALHIACALPEEQDEIVKLLCSHKALTDIADARGFTPLHHACIRGHVAIVEYLLNKGANAAIKTHEQVSPLHLAAQYGHGLIVKLLLEKISLLVDTEDWKGQSALHLAFERYFYLSRLCWNTVSLFKDQFKDLFTEEDATDADRPDPYLEEGFYSSHIGGEMSNPKGSGDEIGLQAGIMMTKPTNNKDEQTAKDLLYLLGDHGNPPLVEKKEMKEETNTWRNNIFREARLPVGINDKIRPIFERMIASGERLYDSRPRPASCKFMVDTGVPAMLLNHYLPRLCVEVANLPDQEKVLRVKSALGIKKHTVDVSRLCRQSAETEEMPNTYPFYKHESADLLLFSELQNPNNKAKLREIGSARVFSMKALSGLENLEQLLFAIDSQNLLIKCLLDAGADMSKEDNRGTPAFTKYAQDSWFDANEQEMQRIRDSPSEAGHDAEIFLDKRTQHAVHQAWVSNGRRCYALCLLFMWITGLLLLTWVALKYSGRDSYEAPSMQAAIRERIGSDEWDEYESKSLEDVGNIAEWQQYLENVFVSSLWETNQTYVDAQGQIRNVGNHGPLLSGHLGLVGRPRYRQLRTRSDACLNENPSVIPQTEDFCFSPYTTRVYGSPLISDEDRRDLLCTFSNGTVLLLEWAEYQSYPVQGRYGYYRDGGFSIDLPSDYEEAISLLHDLGNCNFIDLNTRFAALEFTLYSRSQGLFTYGTVYLELTTTGMISPGQKWRTFKVVSYATHQDLKDIWAEVLLGVFLLCYFASEVWSMFQPWPEMRATKSLRASDGIISNQLVSSKYPAFWYPSMREVRHHGWEDESNAQDAILLFRFRKNWPVYLRKSSYIIPPYLYDGFNFVDVFVMVVVMSLISTHCLLVVQVNVAAPSWYELAASNMYIDVSHFLWLSAWRQYLLAITVFLFYIKTLEYLQVAPWLTIPILVIGGMLSRLAGFFAIFAVFIMAFGLFDYVLYGMEYEPVQSVWRGILGAFRASLGEVDFDGKIETDQTVGVVMSLAAASLLVILLLNLLIAIMNEAYEEIKETAEARWCYKQFSAYLAHQRRETMGFKFQLPFRYLHRLCCTKQKLLKFDVVVDENRTGKITVVVGRNGHAQVVPAP